MSRWEESLIAEMKKRQSEKNESSTAKSEANQLASHYDRITSAFEASIDRIGGAIEASVDTDTATADRRRWTYGTCALALRIDRAASKIFVTADLGTDLVFEELTTIDGKLIDQRHRVVSLEELTKDFISRLFRGR